MTANEVLRDLRISKGISQEELAEKVFVTRQAVSRWETGETLPNTETLKLLSRFYDVSINTLLGSPRKLFCQCCGMPLEDPILSREPDGDINEDYCKWCYSDGRFVYETQEQLIDFCVKNLANDNWPPEQVRAHMEAVLPLLKHWKNDGR
ncbi:MAG: helix-turn-helix domain-containing protein [Clostridia bacterium]|nr:helix-turn-helix domain-containing protein [Clostridia bacterium]